MWLMGQFVFKDVVCLSVFCVSLSWTFSMNLRLCEAVRASFTPSGLSFFLAHWSTSHRLLSPAVPEGNQRRWLCRLSVPPPRSEPRTTREYYLSCVLWYLQMQYSLEIKLGEAPILSFLLLTLFVFRFFFLILCCKCLQVRPLVAGGHSRE